MKKDQVTIYHKDGWAKCFDSKQQLLNYYGLYIIERHVDFHYKMNKVFICGYNEYGVPIKKFEEYNVEYIIRDYYGDPVTANDLYMDVVYGSGKVYRPRKGFPVPNTGKNRAKKLDDRKPSGKGLFKQVSGAKSEKMTDCGLKIPPIRKKVEKNVLSKIFDYADCPVNDLNNKNWKKYRRKQYK